jgi:hypothetical protein
MAIDCNTRATPPLLLFFFPTNRVTLPFALVTIYYATEALRIMEKILIVYGVVR